MNKFVLIILFFIAFCPISFGQNIEDELVKETLSNSPIPFVNSSYNYENTDKLPIRLEIVKPIKSELDVYEGQEVEFRVHKRAFFNDNLVIARGTKVTARVGTIITSGMNGIPASIVFDDFEIEGVPKSKITQTYEVFGQDRSLLVFPLKWALTILPPTGSLTNFIKGGHAKVKLDDDITIFYYPNWN